jgi:hypothetical protein
MEAPRAWFPAIGVPDRQRQVVRGKRAGWTERKENYMKSRSVFVVVACAVLLGLLGGTAWSADPIMNVYVKFDFKVQEKTLPAGYYVVLVNRARPEDVVLKNEQTDEVTQLPIVTRLADTGGSKAKLVFDTEGGEHYLSEIHIPNTDGYALQGAPGEHKHEQVPAEN